MAEAVQDPFMTKYFCYQCDREISIPPSAQIACPDCCTGFVEVVSDGHDDFDTDSVEETESDVDESELNLLNLLSIDNLFRRTVMNVADRSPYRHIFNDGRSSPDPEIRPVVEVLSSRNILEELEDNFARGNYSGLRHIGDYLFGDDIDALTTMLLNDSETGGSPPLPKDQIKKLPVISVAKEDVDKLVQCTICMEDFGVKEKAKSLPCRHFYHESCITPWLERHSTCPNCREPIEIQSKTQRSHSCPRTEQSLRASDHRRASESTSVSGIHGSSRNPFRFL